MNPTITPLICVGRRYGSGGRQLAHRLAERFHCRLLDSELLNLAAKESGFCEDFFKENDEQKGFLQSLLRTPITQGTDGGFFTNRFSQESLFQIQCDAIRKAASQDPCVFVGRCADYVLRDNPAMVSIFVTADTDDCVRRVADRLQCDEAEALRQIERKESQRRSYYNYYTGRRWGESATYDLCINSSRLALDDIVDITAQFITKTLQHRSL